MSQAGLLFVFGMRFTRGLNKRCVGNQENGTNLFLLLFFGENDDTGEKLHFPLSRISFASSSAAALLSSKAAIEDQA